MSALSEPRLRNNQTPRGSHKKGSTMLKWLRKITSRPVVKVDLEWSQEDLDAYLFDPSSRHLTRIEELFTTPPLSEPSYYWRKDGS